MNEFHEHPELMPSEFDRGFVTALEMFAWWKDGIQHVGSCGKTLGDAVTMLVTGEVDGYRVNDGRLLDLKFRGQDFVLRVESDGARFLTHCRTNRIAWSGTGDLPSIAELMNAADRLMEEGGHLTD